MAHSAENHDHHDHDHTEGNRQYYPKGWWVPLIGLAVVLFGFAFLVGWFINMTGTDKWGKKDECCGTEQHGEGHGSGHGHDHEGKGHDAHGKTANTHDHDSLAHNEEHADSTHAGMVMTKLASGLELSGAADGIESKLVAFIDDKSKAITKDTWFDFDRLLFESGKSVLNTTDKGTTEQLDNIANILKAYPTVALKIGGYTDNKGNAALNQKLSSDRAKSVLDELVKRGIDAKRLESEGYGDKFPVGDNATEEGRAQNRRIAVRVTQK
ncbi:MAG: OmpA family protein [Bacteroidia bacterium]